MRILLCYEADEAAAGSKAAGQLIAALHDLLAPIGAVTLFNATYFDERILQGESYDLYVGGPYHLSRIKGLCHIKKSILITTGLHPQEINHSTSRLKAGHNLPDDVFHETAAPNVDELEQSIKLADFIIGIGNIETYNSYIKCGLPKWKIKMLLGGIAALDQPNTLPSSENVKTGQRRVYTYIAPKLGLSNGFEAVFLLFSSTDIASQNLELHVVGQPANKFFNNRLLQLKAVLGDKLFVHGDELNEAQSAELLSNTDFIVYPSLGQYDSSILQGLIHGAIPLVTAQSGIDFSPIGVFDPLDHLQQKQLLQHTLQLSDQEIVYWKKKTIEYVKEYHLPYKQVLDKTIKDCLNGNLYPKISITLPVFNKEATIVPLIAELHRAVSEYKNAELRIIFDGCYDQSEYVVKQFFQNVQVDYSIAYETTPNIFEIKTNNIGLKKSSGAYCVILQDDNYVYDKNIFYEVVQFMDKNTSCAIVGCLSGVNFYPRGTTLSGPGQISCSANEVYWRQDEKADPNLKNRVFEVDACMRGPLVIRKSFLEQYGYLDEGYAPLYQDDMDICFRAKHYGYKVYCMMSDVENRSLTMAHYDTAMSRMFQEVMERNTNIFYARWTPSTNKDYAWIHRTRVDGS